MPIKVKKGGAYVDPVGVFVKKGGVYAAAAGVSVKVAGAYVSASVSVPRGVVTQGDSLTVGLGAIAAGLGTRYAQRSGQTVINRAVGGKQLAAMDSNFATDTATYYSATTADHLYIEGGTNDLFNSGTFSGLQASMTSILAKAKAVGFRGITVGTIPPSSSITGGQETHRTNYNAWLRSTYLSLGATGINDIAAAPESANPADTIYYLDGTHPTDKLIDIWARLMVTATYATAVAAVTTPAAFSFVDVTGAAASTVYTSAAVSVLGINASTSISVVGGSYSINGGAFVTTAGTVGYGDVVRARTTSASADSTTVNCVVTIGGVSDTYSVLTGAAGHVFSAPTFGTATASNGNTTILTTTAACCVPADAAITGKKAFSMLLEASAFVGGMGITSKGGNTGGIGDDGQRSVSFFMNGAIYRAGTSIGTGPTYANGAHVGVVVDVSAAKAWATIDGVTYMPGSLTRAQVEAGTGGVDITSTIATGAVYPGAGGIVSSGQRWTLDAAYAWPIPAGFSQY